MKYIKVFNSKLQQVGVADLDSNKDKTGYVNVLDENLHTIGVMNIDTLPESGDNLPFIEVFDENLHHIGVVTVDNVRKSDGYLITLAADPNAGGTVTGGGRFVEGTEITVAATPAEGYSFGGWYNGETLASENASYTFSVSEAVTLTAKFEVIPAISLTGVSVDSNPLTAGTKGTLLNSQAGETLSVAATCETVGDAQFKVILQKESDESFVDVVEMSVSDGAASGSFTLEASTGYRIATKIGSAAAVASDYSFESVESI